MDRWYSTWNQEICASLSRKSWPSCALSPRASSAPRKPRTSAAAIALTPSSPHSRPSPAVRVHPGRPRRVFLRADPAHLVRRGPSVRPRARPGPSALYRRWVKSPVPPPAAVSQIVVRPAARRGRMSVRSAPAPPSSVPADRRPVLLIARPPARRGRRTSVLRGPIRISPPAEHLALAPISKSRRRVGLPGTDQTQISPARTGLPGQSPPARVGLPSSGQTHAAAKPHRPRMDLFPVGRRTCASMRWNRKVRSETAPHQIGPGLIAQPRPGPSLTVSDQSAPAQAVPAQDEPVQAAPAQDAPAPVVHRAKKAACRAPSPPAPASLVRAERAPVANRAHPGTRANQARPARASPAATGRAETSEAETRFIAWPASGSGRLRAIAGHQLRNHHATFWLRIAIFSVLICN